MAEQLRQRLALLGCELTLLFHDAKNWEGCQHLGQADLMMGDRLIGEAPEYARNSGCAAICCGLIC